MVYLKKLFSSLFVLTTRYKITPQRGKQFLLGFANKKIYSLLRKKRGENPHTPCASNGLPLITKRMNAIARGDCVGSIQRCSVTSVRKNDATKQDFF